MVLLNRVYSPNRPTFEYYDRSWQYFVDSMMLLRERGCVFITMIDAYSGNFNENKINIILDHHIDFYPVEMEVLAKWEEENDIISSIYLYNFSHNTTRGQDSPWCLEDLNIPLYQRLEAKGFEIGYHSNAVGQAQFLLKVTLDRGVEKLPESIYNASCDIFERDLNNLKRYFNVRTFIPHGGGENNNILHPLSEKHKELIWAYNNHRRFGNDTEIPKWRNFSDSNLDAAQKFKVPGGQIITQLDNLKVFCYTAGPGLHHLVLHPGRYSFGMPYNLYSGPSDISEALNITNNNWALKCALPCRSNSTASLDSLPFDKENERKNITYCFSNVEDHLEKTLKEGSDVICFFVDTVPLSREEKTSIKIDRMDRKISFKLAGNTGNIFDDYTSFLNSLRSRTPLTVISEFDGPFHSVVLMNFQSTKFADLSLVFKIIEKCIFNSAVFFIELEISGDLFLKFKTNVDFLISKSSLMNSNAHVRVRSDDITDLHYLTFSDSL